MRPRQGTGRGKSNGTVEFFVAPRLSLGPLMSLGGAIGVTRDSSQRVDLNMTRANVDEDLCVVCLNNVVGKFYRLSGIEWAAGEGRFWWVVYLRGSFICLLNQRVDPLVRDTLTVEYLNVTELISRLKIGALGIADGVWLNGTI